MPPYDLVFQQIDQHRIPTFQLKDYGSHGNAPDEVVNVGTFNTIEHHANLLQKYSYSICFSGHAGSNAQQANRRTCSTNLSSETSQHIAWTTQRDVLAPRYIKLCPTT